ncbi:MAG: hypothetical protein HC888_12265 [Candidatus Competibacteraceae bacterium]|nr:hypothetical protein [Candidatus Competibacteraceae bacterium]
MTRAEIGAKAPIIQQLWIRSDSIDSGDSAMIDAIAINLNEALLFMLNPLHTRQVSEFRAAKSIQRAQDILTQNQWTDATDQNIASQAVAEFQTLYQNWVAAQRPKT